MTFFGTGFDSYIFWPPALLHKMGDLARNLQTCLSKSTSWPNTEQPSKSNPGSKNSNKYEIRQTHSMVSLIQETYSLLKKAFQRFFLPSRNSPPHMMARAQAALIEWSNDWPARFELMRAGTRPILLQPSQRPTYSGLFSQNIYIKTVSYYRLLSTLLISFKLVYGSFGQSNMHRTLDFCPRQAMEMNVSLRSFK